MDSAIAESVFVYIMNTRDDNNKYFMHNVAESHHYGLLQYE